MAFTISGSVTSSLGANVSGTTMSFYSSSGLLTTASSGPTGQYTQSFGNAFTGHAQPTHSEFLYSIPITRSYNDVSTDQNDQDYHLYRFVSGSGTPGNEYKIYDAYELDMVRYEGGAYFQVANDIDMSVFADWKPINTFTSGSFDGNLKTLSNLTMTTLNTTGNGLFGIIDYAGGFFALKNVVLDNASIYFTAGNIDTVRYVGGLVGWMNMGTTSSFSNNRVIDSLIGMDFNLLNKTQFIGGLVGRVFSSAGIVTSCSVEDSTIIRRSSVQASQQGIGGTVGVTNRSFEKCFVNNCIVLGEINAVWQHCGGFAGGIAGTAMARDCYVANTIVSGSSGELLSGFAAWIQGNAQRCYAAVTFEGYDDANDLAPFYSEILSGVKSPLNCYYDSESSSPAHPDSSSNVTGLTTVQAKDSSSYSGWDFETVWTRDDLNNSGYPHFDWDIVLFTLSGSIISSSLTEFVPDVTMSYSIGDEYNVFTDVNGQYVLVVSKSQTGTVTPGANGYVSFLPISRSYVNISGDSTEQDYTGSYHVISRSVVGHAFRVTTAIKAIKGI